MNTKVYPNKMRLKKKIFLSGPIRGVSRKDSLAWREKAEGYLTEKFEVIHALRGREVKETFADPRAAVIRDINDIKEADILLVSDTGQNCSMIGTSMEVFFAFQQNKPVIAFGSAHKNDYWLNYCTHLRVETLEEACAVLNKMFA